MPPPHAPAGRTLAVGLPVWAVACVAAAAVAGELREDHEGPGTRWLPAAGTTARVVIHDRDDGASHRGARCERFVIDAGGAERIRVELPFGPAALLDELRARVWVRCSRGDVRIAVRVVLPEWVSRVSGRAVEVLLPGTASRDVERWEMLEATALPAALGRSLAALRLEHGNDGGPERAVATHVVLDLPPGSGRLELAIDDLAVTGIVPPAATVAIRDAEVRPAALAAAGADPPAGLARGVLEVDGQPFFPRVIDWNGEPLDRLAALGFNAVRCTEPATAGQLDDARRAGLWVVCPPPPIPDVDLREPESLPMLRHWDRVLMWDLGSGLADKDVEALAERTRRLRACDPRPGRPVIAAADSGLRALSRHVDMLVARRQVLGTSLELVDHLRWLRERPRLARPGTPLLATLATETDPRAAAQAAALAGVGGRGLAVDPESLSLAACAAVAAGTRGILCGSTRPLDGDDRESRARAAAAREMNLRLKLLEPWGAAGRFAAQAQASSPEVQAFVLEAARTRIVIAWRCVQGAQIVARRYEGGDLPPTAAPLTIVVPGTPEAHQAWECVSGGLRPLKHQRVTGGVSLTLDDFVSHALVLVSGEPAVTAHVQQRLVDLAPLELVSARELAALGLADAADLLARLPARALSGPPPVAAVAMLSEAGRLAAEGETLAASEPAAATARYRRAAAIAGQFERRVWENAVKAAGSMVASPLCVADTALAEEWNFVAARTATTPGPELVPGGGMERLEELAGAGWRHFARPTADIRSGVEVSRDRPASGAGCLRMTAVPASADEAPVVVETPPVWVTTPPLAAPAGRLVEIAARVRVPRPVSGSVDGLFVFDSLGGPALGERVGVTGEWRRLTLYRIVPAAEAGTPLVVTFALTGIGEACIDDVSVRVLDRLAGGVVATPVAAPAGGTRPFPGPSELLAEPPPPTAAIAPPAAAPPASAAWPGMRMEWPRLLPFGQGSADPPPGPGGGTIDPFKRARATPSPPP